MSTTPRTDEQVFDWTTEDGSDVVFASMARELETELVAMRARAEKAEAELAEAKVERETVAEASLRSLKAYIDKLKQFAERAEKAEAALADWSVLKGWGGTPEIVHKFVKGQQTRIHHCQDIEAELATERTRLDYLGLHMGMPQVSEALNLPFSQCFPIRDAIDAAMKKEDK